VSLRKFLAQAHIDWHGVKLFSPDLSEDSRTLAVTTYMENGPAFHLMLNAFWEPLNFAVPPVPENGMSWVRVIGTSLPAPKDFLDVPEYPAQCQYLVQAHSTVLRISHPAQAGHDFFPAKSHP